MADLIKYFKNLERPFVSKVLTVLFKRLGLEGMYNELWLTNCIQANPNLFLKTGANMELLVKGPKSRHITSSIFLGVPLKDIGSHKRVPIKL